MNKMKINTLRYSKKPKSTLHKPAKTVHYTVKMKVLTTNTTQKLQNNLSLKFSIEAVRDVLDSVVRETTRSMVEQELVRYLVPTVVVVQWVNHDERYTRNNVT